ncbi:unannotated protein [freshwater metagenome]|uniref:Unannotated protein n=1 Tax=freshwater metagenome TaxID=449393 RepID=A0A6J7N5E0_9ZZZZ
MLSQHADDGSLIVLTEVAGSDLVHSLAAMHEAVFPEYSFVTQLLRERAGSTSQVPHVHTHQWLLQVDGSPTGFVLFDTNVFRSIAIIHYIYLGPSTPALKLGQQRLHSWLTQKYHDQILADSGGVQMLGVVAEKDWTSVPYVGRVGMRDLAVEYYEPKVGPRWQGPGSELRRLHLLWLPPADADPDMLEARARHAGAAAFLLDHYQFDADIPWVAAAVGDERDRRPPQAP